MGTSKLSLNVGKTKEMVIGNKAKLSNLKEHAHFNAGNREIMFVNHSKYLGIDLDAEMLLEPLFNNIVKQVEQKLFLLRNIRRYITTRAGISIYKQMILPHFDFAGFMLILCTIGQKRELRNLQNSGIRTCLLYKKVEHISIKRLHTELNILSLEQRR